MTAQEKNHLERRDSQRTPDDSRLALWASWLVVGIPAVWGVSQVVVKSLALFR
ncbi:MAG: hypothetical protein U0132_11550 [Gemmatimonadaceae bacterium]